MDFLAQAAALQLLAAVAAEQDKDQGQNAEPNVDHELEDEEPYDNEDIDPTVTVAGDHDTSDHRMVRRSQVRQAHPPQVPQQPPPPPPQAVVQNPQEPGAVGILPPLGFPNNTRRRRGARRRREQIAVLLQHPVLHLPPLPQAAVEDHQEPGAAVGIPPPLGFPNHTRRPPAWGSSTKTANGSSSATSRSSSSRKSRKSRKSRTLSRASSLY